jgi:hypothetical protein
MCDVRFIVDLHKRRILALFGLDAFHDDKVLLTLNDFARPSGYQSPDFLQGKWNSMPCMIVESRDFCGA